MSQYKKKPEGKPDKKNLGAFMVTDVEKALRDVKRKELEHKDDDDEKKYDDDDD